MAKVLKNPRGKDFPIGGPRTRWKVGNELTGGAVLAAEGDKIVRQVDRKLPSEAIIKENDGVMKDEDKMSMKDIV